MSYNFMVVDDSSTTRTIIKTILGMSGLDIGEIIEAENGADALSKMEDAWVDLVFADINMPQMNGVEMVKKMSESGMLKTVPVVIVSSDGSETRMEELLSEGVRAYLRKPFSPESIKEITEKILGGGKNADDSKQA